MQKINSTQFLKFSFSNFLMFYYDSGDDYDAVDVRDFNGPLDPWSCLAISLEKLANISSLSFEDESSACNFIKKKLLQLNK